MANSTATFKEVRFTGLDTELTQCFVLIEAGGDSPIGVQGWRHKAFPASVSVKDIVSGMAQDSPLVWPLKAP